MSSHSLVNFEQGRVLLRIIDENVVLCFTLPQVSLTQNCQPPRRTGRAAQMQTTFIALLFFPFFVGALSMVAYTAWRYEDVTYLDNYKTLFVILAVWRQRKIF